MEFLKSVSKEMNKVSWLSKKEVLGQFLMIHIIGIIIIFYFGVIDFGVRVIKNIF